MECSYFKRLGFISACVLAAEIIRIVIKTCKYWDYGDRNVAVVLGASTEVGKEVARELASRNCQVVLACSDKKIGKETARDITATTGNCDIIVKKVNLASVKSVRNLLKELSRARAKLHVFVNNLETVVKIVEGTENVESVIKFGVCDFYNG